MENPREIIVNTNTIGMAFSKFCSSINSITNTIKLTNDIEDKDIAIRLHDDSIPLINICIGTDGRIYIVITKSVFMQCEPNGPLTFVINSYQKLIEFINHTRSIYNSGVFNHAVNPIEDAECVVNTEGLITHITYFDLLVKNINRGKDFNPIIYIRSEV